MELLQHQCKHNSENYSASIGNAKAADSDFNDFTLASIKENFDWEVNIWKLII